jgi:hypothetical protein
MRLLVPLFVALGALALASCEDTPAATTSPVRLGKMSVEEFRAEPSYAIWFDPTYQGFPGTAAPDVARFNANVEQIRAAFDADHHSVMMIVKPTCSCANTKQYMPQVLRTLDAAGIPHEKIEIWVTDSHMGGFDSIKNTHNPEITVAPTFMVMKDGVEKGRIADKPADGSQVDIELARYFQVP